MVLLEEIRVLDDNLGSRWMLLKGTSGREKNVGRRNKRQEQGRRREGEV